MTEGGAAIVLDASAAVELVVGTPAGQRVADRIRSAEVALHAPHLLDIEVAQVLRRYVASGALAAARGRQALDALLELDVQRYSHEILLPRVWALRENLTAYDAAYVALAEALGATLLTGDVRLAQAPGLTARIESL